MCPLAATEHEVPTWRSPGKSPVSDPCGVASGYPNGNLDGNQVPASYRRGQPGSSLPAALNATATWQKGAMTVDGRGLDGLDHYRQSRGRLRLLSLPQGNHATHG